MNSEIAPRKGNQPQPRNVVAFAVCVTLACLAVAAADYLRRKPADGRDSRALNGGDECELSECGADGVPSSLYAG